MVQNRQEARQAAAEIATGERAADDLGPLADVRKTRVRANATVLGIPAGTEADVPYDDVEVRALLDNGMLERVDA